MATINYYNENYPEYDTSTNDIKLTEQWNQFLAHVRQKGLILDVGCGTGRDMLHFQHKGFHVEGIEPSSQMARISRERTGALIDEISVENLKYQNRYDGIWACASLLHLPKSSLPNTLRALIRALKKGSPMYISLKQGTGDIRKPDGRYFSSYLPAEITEILNKTRDIYDSKIWITDDATSRNNTKWINILITKQFN